MRNDLLVAAIEPAVINATQRRIKRLLDIVLTAVLLALTWPLFISIAILIWVERSGPVLFQQQRVGEGGRLFTMYKFRTMILGAEALEATMHAQVRNGTMQHKRSDDPRVTPLGRWLRRTSLDELPQLVNVLRGDMSLVGPRPELPWLVAQYEPWQYRRLGVPQGLTGLWQINGRAQNPMHLSTDIDLDYVEHYSLWLDLSILVKTPLAVWRGDGAF